MSGRLRQLHTAVACSAGMLVMGALNVWPSYTIHVYKSNTTTPLAEPMTHSEQSLLGSLPSLGAMAGSMIAGPTLNKLGRRNGGIVLSLPFLVSWGIISLSSTTNLVLACRFLGGLAGGAVQTLAPIFISEVVEDSIRGALASVPLFFYYMGVVFSYLIGWFLTYKTIIWVHMMFSIIYTILIALVIESPVFLLRQNRDEDARVAMAKYRGVSASSMAVIDEINRIKQHITPSFELVPIADTEAKVEEAEKERLNIQNVVAEKTRSMSPIKLLFLSPASRRGFIVVFSTISLQVLMGMVPVQVYAKSVFQQTDPVHADLYTVVFAFTLLAGGAVTIIVTDKAGRRLLIIGSSVLVGICMVSLGFLIGSKEVPALVIVGLILAYCFSFMLGAGTIPYVLLTEVFNSEVQGIASIILIETMWFLNFFIIGVFPYMLKGLGINGSFFFFACTSAANAIISYFIVPETKGLSNSQIQDLLITCPTERSARYAD